MAQFLQIPANDKIVQVQELSRAGFRKLLKGDKCGVMIKLSRCDAKIVTSFLLIPAVVPSFFCQASGVI